MAVSEFITPFGSGGSGSGTVTEVSSADGNATITDPTTTPEITIVSAPKLETARAIAGVSFNGTANIDIPSTGLSDSADLIREDDNAVLNSLQIITGAALSGGTPSDAGLVIPNDVPASTTDALYNDAGTLKFNGSAIGGGSPKWEFYETLQGTTTNAAAQNIFAVAFPSGFLTIKDTLVIELAGNSVTQQTSNFRPIDSGLNDITPGGTILAGTQKGVVLFIKPYLSNLSQGMVLNGDLASGAPTTISFATAWTGTPQFGFRHDGVTSGGTLHYCLSIYIIRGQ